MMQKAILGCIFAMVALSAGAQYKPLAAPPQEFRVNQPNGTKVVAALKQERTNSLDAARQVQKSMRDVMVKVCKTNCVPEDTPKLKENMKEALPNIVHVTIIY